MRIVLGDYSGHPFQVQLSRELARRGHDVLHLHFAEFQSPKGKMERQAGDPPRFAVEAMSLGRPFAKTQWIKRRNHEIEIGHIFAARIRAFGPDTVIASNFPLDTLAVIAKDVKRLGKRLLFWQQDIYSVAIKRIMQRRFGLPGRLIGAWYHALEGRILRAADWVVAISPDFVPFLSRDFRVDPCKITVIENWAPLDELVPGPKDNAWAAAHGLTGREVVLYTGTLGMKHDPAILLEIAQGLRARPGAVMVVTSEGPGADWLKAQKAGNVLEQLLILPFQSWADYPQVLSSADILVSILEPDAGYFSVPSKVLSYLCAGRAIVLSAPKGNLAFRIVEKASAGKAVEAGDRAAVAAVIAALLNDPEGRVQAGMCAQAYAQENFNIVKITDRFEAVIGAVAA